MAIQADLKAYETDLEQLNLDIQSFNQRAASGGFGSRSEFQAARDYPRQCTYRVAV